MEPIVIWQRKDFPSILLIVWKTERKFSFAEKIGINRENPVWNLVGDFRLKNKLERIYPEWAKLHQRELHQGTTSPEIIFQAIKNFTKEGDLVIDICMGTETTGVVCHYSKRKYLGAEKQDWRKRLTELQKKKNGKETDSSKNTKDVGTVELSAHTELPLPERNFFNLFSFYCSLQTDASPDTILGIALIVLSDALDTDSKASLSKAPATNIFFGIVGPTSIARKSTLLGIAEDDFGINVIPSATPETTIKKLSNDEIRKGLLDCDEFSKQLSNIQRGSYLSEAPEFWNKLWDNKKLTNAVTIRGSPATYETPGEDTYFGMLAASTPDAFRDTITDKVLRGGTFNRYMWNVVEGQKDEQPQPEETPQIKYLRAYLQRYLLHVKESCYFFEFDYAAYVAIFKKIKDWKKGKDPDLLARLDHHTTKVARLVALDRTLYKEIQRAVENSKNIPRSEEPRTIEVTQADLETAWEIVRKYAEQSLSIVPADWIPPKETKAVIKTMIRLHEEGKVVDNRSICRSLHGFHVDRLMKIIQSLETGDLVKTKEKEGKKFYEVDIDALKGKNVDELLKSKNKEGSSAH